MAASREQYIIVRSFYRKASDMEAGRYYREASVGFKPTTMAKAQILKSKLTEYKNSILRIVPSDYLAGVTNEPIKRQEVAWLPFWRKR